MLTLTLLSLLLCAQDPAKKPADLPLTVPEGWESTKQDGGRVIAPKGIPEGKVYTIVVPELTTRVGSLKELLAVGKTMLSETGKFAPLREPASAKNDAGWEYEVVIGTLEQGGARLMAQILGIRKGEEEGFFLLISDSVETMEKYSDAFTGMIKSLGAPKPAPAGKVDLKYKVPEGWSSKAVEGGILLEKSKNEFYEKYLFRLLILPSEPLQENLRKTFVALWAAQMKPAVETTIVPLPMIRRLKSGMALAFDADGGAKNKQDVRMTGVLYLLARGTRVVPVAAFLIGYDKTLEKDLEAFLESAEIPGSGSAKVELVSAADFPGEWKTSSASYASYVTPSGGYAGDASISTASTFVLKPDGTFQSSFTGVTSKTVVREKDEGKWSIEDDILVLAGAIRRSYAILGFGSDAKAGTFLVLNSYSTGARQQDFASPRAGVVNDWFRKKD
jgi:hypothetical protein